MITATLRESNCCLLGRCCGCRRRSLSEANMRGEREVMRSAADGATVSAEFGARDRLLREYERALRDGDEGMADEFHEALNRHHRQQGAATDAKPATAREARELRYARGRLTLQELRRRGPLPGALDTYGWMKRLFGG
jgi:hypothetical protein